MDYEYGYDYERVIKDRLKVANEAFASDSTPPLKKSTRVSFDNAVTAVIVDEKVDEMAKIKDGLEPIEDEKTLIQEENDDDETNNKLHLEKVPLNDTIKKDNPDEFANKLKEIVARYDADHNPEIIEHHKVHQTVDVEDEESELFFMKYKPIHKDSADNIHNVNETLNNTISPSSNNNHNNTVSIKKKTSFDTTNVNGRNSPFERPSSKNSDNDNKNNINNNVNNKTTKADNSNENLNRKNSNQSKSQEDLLNKTNRSINSPTRLSSNSTESPNSIYSPSATPPPPERFSFSAIDKQANDSKTKKSNSIDENTNRQVTINDDALNKKQEKILNKRVSDSPSLINSQNDNSENKSSTNKVVVEKDGKFLFVNEDEYLAREKLRESSNMSQNSLLPHPPTRPKTSNGRNKTSFKVGLDTKNNTRQSNSPALIRKAHSADGRNRQKNIQNEKTPDYGQDYRSPYAASPRRSESQQNSIL